MNDAPVRSFAIVPCAGRSLRMGTAKLLLPWRGRTVIEAVISAWKTSQVDQVIAVVRGDDPELAEVCRRSGASVVIPATAPPEMKDSVLAALDFIEEKWQPRLADAWLLAPADIPQLASSTIDALLAAHLPRQVEVLLPMTSAGRGHPVLFSWSCAEQVRTLADDEGVNALLERNPTREIFVAAAKAADIDTPEDYRGLLARDGQHE